MSIEADFAVESVGPVPTLDTLSGLCFAGSGVSVALAGLAVGEIPVSGLALVAPAAIGVLCTVALAVCLATERVKGAQVVAVASWNEVIELFTVAYVSACEHAHTVRVGSRQKRVKRHHGAFPPCLNSFASKIMTQFCIDDYEYKM